MPGMMPDRFRGGMLPRPCRTPLSQALAVRGCVSPSSRRSRLRRFPRSDRPLSAERRRFPMSLARFLSRDPPTPQSWPTQPDPPLQWIGPIMKPPASARISSATIWFRFRWPGSAVGKPS